MNIKSVLGFGLLAGAAWYFLRTKSLVKNAKFSFQKMSINWKKKQILIGIGVQNPTNGSFSIQSISGELLVNKNSIATIESNVNISIAPNGNSIIPLILRPSLLGLFSQIKQLLTKQKKGADGKASNKIAATFVGVANANGLIIPLNLQLI